MPSFDIVSEVKHVEIRNAAGRGTTRKARSRCPPTMSQNLSGLRPATEKFSVARRVLSAVPSLPGAAGTRIKPPNW